MEATTGNGKFKGDCLLRELNKRRFGFGITQAPLKEGNVRLGQNALLDVG